VSLESIYEAVLNGDAKTTEAEVTAALESDIPPGDILYKACVPGMAEVGRLFEEGEKFVPEMLIAKNGYSTSSIPELMPRFSTIPAVLSTT
jgi:5-methyltetrahydrofolate--homocysteine methyltransferase